MAEHHSVRFKPVTATVMIGLAAPSAALAQSAPRLDQTLLEVKVSAHAEAEGFKTEGTGSAIRTDTPSRDFDERLSCVSAGSGTRLPPFH